MDWIKIKTQHVLFSGLTDEQVGVLIKFQCLVAHLEKHPSESEIKTVIKLKKFQKFLSFFEKNGENLQKISEKILEDVIKISKNREKSLERVGKYRGFLRSTVDNCNALQERYSNADVTLLDKIRIDKRENKQEKKEKGLASQPQKEKSDDKGQPASLFFENFKADDLETLLEKIVKIRMAKRPEALKMHLRLAFQNDPNEAKKWLEEVALVVLESESVSEKMEELRVFDFEVNERKRLARKRISTMTDEQIEDIRNRATADVLDDCPAGFKPAGTVLEGLVAERVNEILEATADE
jgi:hypothetical protein